RWLSVLSHSISAYLAFLGGLIFIVSATLPTSFSRLPEFLRVLPKSVLGAGHLVCALSGTALLFVSYGLEKRNAKAFSATVALFVAGIAGAFLKGFSWEVCVMAAIILLAICLARNRFYRNSSFFEQKTPYYWSGAAFTAIAFVFALGWFLYHPMWDKAATWGFDKPFNSSRALLAYICMIAMLMVGWLWKMWLRKKASGKN
ncbi:MAG: lysylphosphatidylglycerol synthetase family protein, partial [Desulfovibrio sp.]|nr:lysylphosphatidylglycerol synthetase family protein [Desulfovibrio sp.]